MAESCERKFERWRRKGDTDALADVFDAIAPRLLRLAIHLVGDVAAAEDLVQSTFVAAIEDAASWDSSRPLEPWLTGILDNRAKRLLQSRERSTEIAAREDVDHDTPLARAVENETSREIVKAIDQLDEPYRSVMVLSLLHHLEPAAIAHALDRSPGAVRVQLHRGREMVRKLLPVGVLTSAAILAGSARGLAAVKTAVLAQVHHVAATSALSTAAGALVMKKALIASALLMLVVGGITLAVILAEERSPSPGGSLHDPLASNSSRSGDESTSNEPGPLGAARSNAVEAHHLTITGRVIDTASPRVTDAGSPDVGCPLTITLGGADGKSIDASLATKSDSRGEFRVVFERPRDGVTFVRVACEADERWCAALTVHRIEPDSARLDDLVVARPARDVLHGVVVDAHDAPLAGAVVRYKPWDRRLESLTAVSDAAGRFEIFPEQYSIAGLEVELAGFTAFEGTDARIRPTGGFEPALIVLARRGRLRVHVSSADGKPIAHERVCVSSASSEPGRTTYFSVSGAHSFTAETEGDGSANFEDLWVGKRLEVSIGRYQLGETAQPDMFECMNDGCIVPADSPGAAPILIGSSGELDVAWRRDPEIQLRGMVRRGEGLPAPNAVIEVREAGALQSSTRALASAVTEGDGTFAVGVPWNPTLGGLRVTAAAGAWEKKNWLTDEDKPMDAAGSVLVDPSHPEACTELEIQLTPMHSISGHVLIPGATKTSGRITAAPAGSDSSIALGPLGRVCLADIAKDGSFRIENLSAGRYDLHVECNSADAHFEQVARDVEADRTDVSIRIDPSREARIHVRVRSDHGAVSRVIVMHGRRYDQHPNAEGVPPLPQETTVSSLASWPCEAPLNLIGSGGRWTRRSRTIFDFKQSKSSDCDVAPKVCGDLYIGVEAELADGRQCFPVSTGLVHVGPGDHTITFVVVPTADLEGHVHGVESIPLAEVSLVDESGKPLPLFNGAPGRPALSLSMGLRDDGWFRLASAPLGRFRLRVGSRDQIAHGAFAFERVVEVVEKGLPIEIDARE